MKSLASSLFLKNKINLTLAKAKELSIFAEKTITRAKAGDLQARKFLAGVFAPKIAEKVMKEIAPAYKERKGGYTRIIKLGPRKSDGTKIAQIELVK